MPAIFSRVPHCASQTDSRGAGRRHGRWQAAAMERSAGIGALLRRMEGALPLEASGDPPLLPRDLHDHPGRGRGAEQVPRPGGSSAGRRLRRPLPGRRGGRPGRPPPTRAVGGRLRRRRRRWPAAPAPRPARHERPHQSTWPSRCWRSFPRARVRRPGAAGQPPRRPRAHRPGPGRPVGAEDTELEAAGGPCSRTDRLLQPLNRSPRFLRESRATGGLTRRLDAARRTGSPTPGAAARRARTARRPPRPCADLMAPARSLALASMGFGVQLPAA